VATWRLAPRAEEDILSILTYIAKESDSLDVARRVLDDLEAAFETLALQPTAGHRKPTLTDLDIRWWIVHSYWIVYEARTESILILRVIHGARMLDDVLRDFGV